MVVGPAWSFRGTVLELVIVFAERVSGAFVFAFLVAAAFLEEVAFGSKLFDVEFERDDFLTEEGALCAGGRGGHGNSSEQAEVRRWLKLIKGCGSRCVQSWANE